MKYHFIVNPNSGNGSGMTAWKKTEELLMQKRVDYSIYLTTGRSDALKKSREITDGMKEEAAVITIGGDGTINEVLNGLNLEAPVIFGFVPSGSGNDLGRSIGMKGSVDGVIQKIIDEPYIACMDFGVLTLPSGGERRFAVSCGTGFDAAVCHAIDKSSLKDFFNRLKIGRAGYTAIGLDEFLKAKPVNGRVTLDGEKKIDCPTIFFLSFQNHPYEGGGYLFAPKADWKDGKIDITAVTSCDKGKLFPILINKKKGVSENDFVKFYTCREVKVQLDSPLPVHADGENMGRQTEFSVRCEHGKLRVFI